jgi:hypothetical protein
MKHTPTILFFLTVLDVATLRAVEGINYNGAVMAAISVACVNMVWADNVPNVLDLPQDLENPVKK